ncbi:hypothetical protein IHE61_31200 [Streptomyces sp. GKU 257-1]|nr:hypothetical protein [Streptomyces sp. GKU 257-1]
MRAVKRAASFVFALLIVVGLASPSVAAAHQAQRADKAAAVTIALTDDGDDKKDKEKKEDDKGIFGKGKEAADNFCKSGWHYLTSVSFGTCNALKGLETGVEIAKDPKDAAKKAATEVAETAVDPFASNVAKFVGDMMKSGITWWLTTPSLTVKSSGVVDDEIPENEQHRVLLTDFSLQSIMLGIGVMIAILLTIFQGIRTIIQRKGTPLLQVAQGLMMNVLVLAVGITVIDSLIVGADTLTVAILETSFGEGGKEAPQKMVTLLLPQYGNPAGVLFMAVIVFLVGVVQLALLFARQAAIPIQALLLPIAGAGQIGADSTRKWLPRLITAILSCILYKPAAAVIFAVGFIEIDNSSSILDWLRGVMTLLLSIFALKGLWDSSRRWVKSSARQRRARAREVWPVA